MAPRELDDQEIKRLMTPPTRGVKLYDPVVYRGLDASNRKKVKKVLMQYTVQKVVAEDDAEILIRNGWVIVEKLNDENP